MADPQEEVLRFRLEGAQQARTDLQQLAAQLQQYRTVLDQFGGVQPQNLPAGLPRPQRAAYSQAYFQYQSSGAQAQDLARKVADMDRAQAQLDSLGEQQSGVPRFADALTRYLQTLKKFEGRQQTPAVTADLEQQSQQIERYLASAQNANTGTRRQQIAEAAGRRIDSLQNSLDDLITIPIDHAERRIRDEVRRRSRQGAPMTPGQYRAYASSVRAGQLAAPDEDPEAIEGLHLAGLGPAGRAWHGLRSRYRLKSLGGQQTMFAAGFAAMQMGDTAAQVVDMNNSGVRYTPEAMDRARYGLIPAALALAAAPLGAGGSMAAGGVGTVITGALSTTSQREESLRLASQDLSMGLGQGTAAVHTFTETIRAAAGRVGTPVVELAQALTMLRGSVGFWNTAGAAGTQAGLQLALGENYMRVAQSQASFTAANPLADSYRDMVAGRGPVGRNFADAALFQAIQGNPDYQSQVMGYGASVTGGRVSDLQRRVSLWQARSEGDDPVSRWVNSQPWSHDGRVLASLRGRLAAAQRDERTGAAGLATEAGRLLEWSGDVGARVQYQGERAGASGVEAATALARGGGAAGAASDVAAQVGALRAQLGELTAFGRQLASQQAGASPGNREMYEGLLAQNRAQQAAANAGIVQAMAGQFRERLSEREAEYGSVTGRQGVAADVYTLRGGSAFGLGANYRQRGAEAAARGAQMLALANDGSNFLSPQERAQYRLQAAQLDAQRFQLANELSTRQVGETQGAGAVRQARVGVGVATAQVYGDPVQRAAQESAQLGEQVRLRRELEGLLATGNFTLQQRQQIQGQILDMTAQEVTARERLRRDAVAGVGGMAQDAAAAMGARAGRFETYTGTTASTRGMRAAQLAESVQAARAAQVDVDTAPNEADRLKAQGALESAKAGIDQQVVQSFSTLQMSPQEQSQRARLQGALTRQRMSVFAPGVPLTELSRLNGMDERRLRDFQRLREQDRREGKLYAPVDAAITSQEEDLKTGILERQDSMNTGWMDRLVTMSIGAPSFASRVMPAPSDVAALAERRGLGPMSARVFGFTRQSSYRDAAALGLTPSETSRYAFGYRPGDIARDGPGGPQFGAAGDGGALTPGMPSDAVGPSGLTAADGQGASGAFVRALQTLTGAIERGITVTIHQVGPNSNDRSTTVVNASHNSDSRDLMRGGAGQTYNPGRF